jgi:hypothetical protein
MKKPTLTIVRANRKRPTFKENFFNFLKSNPDYADRIVLFRLARAHAKLNPNMPPINLKTQFDADKNKIWYYWDLKASPIIYTTDWEGEWWG